MERCGSRPVLQRRVAWIVRFCQRIANGRIASSTGPLTLEELSQSTQAIARIVQNECSPQDVKEVSQNKKVKVSRKPKTTIRRRSLTGSRTIAESCSALMG